MSKHPRASRIPDPASRIPHPACACTFRSKVCARMALVDSVAGDPPDRHREVISKVTRRLIPFAFICYVVAYIDRVNVGFAATVLQRDLGLTDTQYGYGAGLS